ncbi:hypothetical protein L1987_87285 [Smallanthus sonchifolius]|nr:hypothetical protein L1987_87285 [Smallanthus sonchifolius]
MIDCSLVPDLMTMTSVISGCEFVGDERLREMIHGYATKHACGKDVSVGNSLIQFYSSIGACEEAEKVFTGIRSKDVVSWTSMISCYENNGLSEKAVEVYKKMKWKTLNLMKSLLLVLSPRVLILKWQPSDWKPLPYDTPG